LRSIQPNHIVIILFGDLSCAKVWTLARFYFHLSTPDEYFHDRIGWDLSDLAAAHSAATHLAYRVMRFVPFFSNRTIDFRRWTVEVMDERQHCLAVVIFPPTPQNPQRSEAIVSATARSRSAHEVA
jgi:hypothetical protein